MVCVTPYAHLQNAKAAELCQPCYANLKAYAKYALFPFICGFSFETYTHFTTSPGLSGIKLPF